MRPQESRLAAVIRSLALAVGLANLFAVAAAADVIVLKSGRRIHAFNVEERGERVYYETEAGRIGLPKRIVARIERGSYVPPRPRVEDSATVELPGLSDADVQRVVSGGRVDRALLAKLEREAGASGSVNAAQRAAAAHLLISQHEEQSGDLRAAVESMRSALGFASNHSGLLLRLASLEVALERYNAALSTLQPVLGNERGAFAAYRLQGWIYYRMEKVDLAITAWKKALELRPDGELRAQLDKIEGEARAARDFSRRGGGRLLLRYHGGVAEKPELARSILSALDGMYSDFMHAFDVVPREPIVVLLYPNETFYNLTGVPSNVHGIFDGKIRVPVEGLSSLSPQLEQTLRHEMVHAFVYLKSRGRAGRWLQEGLGQWHANQRPRLAPASFRPLFQAQDGSALSRIEAAFSDPAQVRAAYAASWLVVDTLSRRYSSRDMVRLLELLGRGESLQAALRRAYHLGLADLDRLVYETIR